MSWWTRLLTGADDRVIPNWSAARAASYQRATFRYLGIRPEAHFMWSRKYRPKVTAKVLKIADRKRA